MMSRISMSLRFVHPPAQVDASGTDPSNRLHYQHLPRHRKLRECRSMPQRDGQGRERRIMEFLNPLAPKAERSADLALLDRQP